MKKKPLLTILFLSFIFNLIAQQNISFVKNEISLEQAKSFEKVKLTKEAETVSLIADELKLLITYLSNEVEYPALSRAHNKEGKVVIQFMYDGRISDFKVTESLNAECEKMIEGKMNTYIEEWNKTAESKIKEIVVNIPIDFSLGL